MRKTMLFLILSGLLLVAAGCGGGSSTSGVSTTSSTSLKSVPVSTPVKQVIEKYFTTYFNAEKSLNYSRMDSSIIVDNEDTQISETAREMEIERKKLCNEGISYYRYDITYQKISVGGDETTIELTLNLKFHYSTAPSDLNSAMDDIKYSFSLKNNGSGLVITKIDSDFEEFKYFKTAVQEALAQNSTLSKAAAVEQVRTSRNNQLEMMRCNKSLYLNGAASTTSASPSACESSTSTNNSDINKSVYVSCNQFKYDTSSVVAYAAKYYNVEEDKSVSPIFCFAYNERGAVVDCTNFVSQCVWAGYTGFKATSTGITTATNYISKTIGMVPTKWTGTKDSVTTNWANVKMFFKYMVTPKEVGPNATTDFDNYDTKHHYTTIAASSINVGDVIQLWDDREGYCHSLIITRKSGSDYPNLYYSAHTNPRSNISLTYATQYNPYIRRLTPAATCYLKTY